jgi:hypothetical protein
LTADVLWMKSDLVTSGRGPTPCYP